MKDWWELLFWNPIAPNLLPVNEIENETRVQILIQANLAKLNDGCASLKWMTQIQNVMSVNEIECLNS